MAESIIDSMESTEIAEKVLLGQIFRHQKLGLVRIFQFESHDLLN